MRVRTGFGVVMITAGAFVLGPLLGGRVNLGAAAAGPRAVGAAAEGPGTIGAAATALSLAGGSSSTEATFEAPLTGGVTVLSPNGGEVAASGSTYTIEWEGPPNATTYKLEYSPDEGFSWSPIISNVVGTSFPWHVPALRGNKARSCIRVKAYDGAHTKLGSDVSDSVFTVQVVKVVAPNGGETYHANDYATITWQTNATAAPVDRVKIYSTCDAGRTWTRLGSVDGDPGSFSLVVPNPHAVRNKCKVKVLLTDAGSGSLGKDTSDNWFTVTP